MAERSGIMLAHKLTDTKWAKLTKPAIVQPKYNGNRCRVIFNGDGDPTLLSSSEAEITSVNHLKPQLKALNLYNMELDGELYKHGLPHQEINQIVRRTNTVHANRGVIEYHLFDAPADQLKQFERIHVLNAVQERARERHTTHIKFAPYFYVNDMKEVLAKFSEFVNYGYEGIILRDLNAYYVRKKCNTMLKFKPDKSESYPIIGFIEGITKVCEECYNTSSRCGCEDTKIIDLPAGILGAVSCITKTGKKFNLGGGPFLTKENRIKFWTNPEVLVGKTAVAKFYEKSVDGAPKSGVLIDVV